MDPRAVAAFLVVLVLIVATWAAVMWVGIRLFGAVLP